MRCTVQTEQSTTQSWTWRKRSRPLLCPLLSRSEGVGPPLTSHNPPGSSITQRCDWCCKSRAGPGSVSRGDCVRSPQALTEISWNSFSISLWPKQAKILLFSLHYSRRSRNGEAACYKTSTHIQRMKLFWWECQKEL